MYLKALEMQGFKSFPDKTVLEFGKGVTAVVGPNGSGKSNISDAVRWVLGEQSTKSLRGAKMEDVIFSGTNERRPQGFAEVTLKLDNSDGALKREENEVSVTRRYYRSGDSAYLINGTPVRLRDVNELFMDTGLGRDGYSMVGQGKIEDMVAAKSENRRDMFEEAAGISHYRYRRADALKRLDQAEENLVRLRDIVTELEGRIGPLEKQSIKAQQFLVYAAERKELEIGLWVNILNRSGEQIREQANRLTVAQNHYDITGHVLEKLSADIDNATTGTRDINIKTEEIRAASSHLEEQASALEAQAAVYENSVEHNSETAQRIERDILSENQSAADIENEINDANERIAALTLDIENANKELGALGDRLSGLRSRDEEYSDEYNVKNEIIAALTLKLSQIDVMISASKSSADEIRARLESVDGAVSEKQELISSLEAQKKQESEILSDCEQQALSYKNMVSGYEIRVKNAGEKTERLKEAYENKKLTMQSAQSRLHFLEDTEKNMDGYQGSVKAVMKEAGRGLLKGIRGTLFQLINVQSQYSTAIETALGNAIQDIVTENENDAKKAIMFLKDSSGGRATFLPMSSVRGRSLDEKGLDDCYGFVNCAAELVKCSPEYSEIVKSLLGRIAVAEDLDAAIAIAKKYNYKFKIVTLDGQVMNAGGSMTGGSKTQNSGFLARRSEAQKLKEEIEKLDAAIASALSDYKLSAENYSKERADLEGARADLIRENEEKIKCESALNLTVSKIEEVKKSLDELIAEKDNSGKRIAYFEENIAIAEKEKAGVSGEKTLKEQELELLTGGRDTLMNEREKLNGEMSEVNMRIVAAMQESLSKKDSVDSLIRRRSGIEERLGELDAEKQTLAGKNSELLEKAQDTRASARLLRSEAEKNAGEIEELIAKRDSFEKIISDSRLEEKQKTEDREKLGAEIVRLEERKASLEKEQSDTEKRLYEEYSLTRLEAMECAPEIESVAKAQKRLSELKASIKALGSVNVVAIDEYKEVSSRYEFLSGQVNDVEKAKKELLKLIDELTQQMSELFKERFDAINSGFKETFSQLFGGGAAELILEDESDILECGIEIKAQPPGKNVKSLTLLSGGEKGLTAIALLFAILKVRPAPFCIFDEVEAALDDVNVSRYAQFVRMMTDNTQFILITHRRGTMEEADILYGVTMQEHGVSKLLELKTAEMVEQLRLEE